MKQGNLFSAINNFLKNFINLKEKMSLNNHFITDFMFSFSQRGLTPNVM